MLELDPAQLHVNRQWVLKAEQERLTDFATVTRYPGDYEPITLAEARRAVAVAHRVRRQIRRWLPKETLSARRG